MKHLDVIERAAAGEMPGWAVANADRRAHALRVADLLGEWAAGLAVSPADTLRWRAAGVLHDALRDAEPEQLRSRIPPHLVDLPPLVLHGPAAAERLRVDGVEDGELLRAVAYHTLGSPHLGRLGLALYAADFLEPGRDLLNEWRAGLRTRMPDDLMAVARDILRARVAHLLESGRPVRQETMAFWNSLASEG